MRPEYMSESQYHALKGVRASYVKRLWSATPAHVLAEMSRADADESDALRVGRALHCALLRPSEYAAEFRVAPKFDRRTKAGKEAAAEFAASLPAGVALLDPDEAECVAMMRDGVSRHDAAAALLDICDVREAVFRGEIAGVPAKCKVDAMSASGILLDVKTTVSAAPRAFARSCGEYGYHVQAAFYRAVLACHGVNVDSVAFVAVEKSAPYCVAVYQLDMADVDAMSGVVERLCAQYARCMETGVWDGYPRTVQPIRIPEWAIRGESNNGEE